MKKANMLLFALIVCGCSDNDPPTGPTTGSIEVSVTTTGEDAPTGYTVSLDGSTTRSVDANGNVTFASVSTGGHSIGLTDVPANCTVAGNNPITVSVVADEMTTVSASVACAAVGASLRVSVTTTGSNVPSEYIVIVDGRDSLKVAANGSVTFAGLEEGEHEVALAQIPQNCAVSGTNPVSATVIGGTVADVAMDVACESDSRIAFISDRDGDYDIYVVNPDGTGLAQIANSSGVEQNPRWSPDGDQIAFETNRDGVGNVEIYVANLGTSALLNLSDDTAIDQTFSWAPDGTAIAFFSNRDPFGIYIGKLDGTPPFRIGGGTNPEWSPDGSRIVVDGMWVMNADGTDPVKLTDDLGLDYQAAWSPDGGRIAFIRESDSGQDIYVVDSNGSDMRAITTTGFSQVEEHPTWSPDGTRILCDVVSGPGSSHGVYVMNGDGTGVTFLADGSAPSWSPDGSQIAFASSRDGNNEIYVMNADGSEQTRLTASNASDLYPVWSPSRW